MAALGSSVDWVRSAVLGDRWTADELFEVAAGVEPGAGGLVFLDLLADLAGEERLSAAVGLDGPLDDADGAARRLIHRRAREVGGPGNEERALGAGAGAPQAAMAVALAADAPSKVAMRMKSRRDTLPWRRRAWASGIKGWTLDGIELSSYCGWRYGCAWVRRE